MQFPVLMLKNRVFGVLPTMEDLTTTNPLALKNGFFRGLEIVDSTGTLYRVKDAVRVKTLKRSFNTGFFLNPIVRVRLEMEGEGRPIALERAKQLVLRAFDADPIFWEAGGNLDEVRDHVRRAESVQEVMTVLKREAKA